MPSCMPGGGPPGSLLCESSPAGPMQAVGVSSTGLGAVRGDQDILRVRLGEYCQGGRGQYCFETVRRARDLFLSSLGLSFPPGEFQDFSLHHPPMGSSSAPTCAPRHHPPPPQAAPPLWPMGLCKPLQKGD